MNLRFETPHNPQDLVNDLPAAGCFQTSGILQYFIFIGLMVSVQLLVITGVLLILGELKKICFQRL